MSTLQGRLASNYNTLGGPLAHNAGVFEKYNTVSSGGGGGSGTNWVTGQTAGTARNNFTADNGLKLTVGASDVVVTHLGRWVISGNNQIHTLKIVTGTNGGAGTTVASVSINTSGLSPGWNYVALAGSYTMLAGGVYHIYSSEVSGSDQWLDNDTTLSTTAVATLNGSSYLLGTINDNIDTGHAYVGVSFKYSSP